MSRILSLDFGERRIGLAISDETRIIARPFGVVTIKETRQATRQIKAICQKENIGELVVGLPLNLKGEEGIQAKKVKKFVEDLRKEISLPIFFEDERLSTKEAVKILKQKGVKNINEKIDTMAALLILKQHLEHEDV